MDENLVIHAVQHKNSEDFKDRYSTFPSERERDEFWTLISDRQPDIVLDTIAKVTLIIRVETEY